MRILNQLSLTRLHRFCGVEWEETNFEVMHVHTCIRIRSYSVMELQYNTAYRIFRLEHLYVRLQILVLSTLR